MSLCEPTDPDDVAGRLNWACQTGSLILVKNVVQECNIKNLDMLDAYGSPPLYNAAMKSDNAELVTYLLDQGATIGLKNSDNETALFIAVFNNHINVVKILIARGAKVEEKGGAYGDGLLHVCIKNNLHTMLNLIMSHNVNVNCRNNANETPLWLACKHDRVDLAYTLLMNKANKGLAAEGKDCLYIASEKKHGNIVKLLKASGPAELMQVKQSFHKSKHAPEKRESWSERAFREELNRLGISEEQAGRKPRELPKYDLNSIHDSLARATSSKPKRPPGAPRPLFDSDEDDDEREQRLKQEESRAPPSPRMRYQDPEGTTYNPTGALHLRDVEKTKEAFRNCHPEPSKPVVPPPPGLVENVGAVSTGVDKTEKEKLKPPPKGLRSSASRVSTTQQSTAARRKPTR